MPDRRHFLHTIALVVFASALCPAADTTANIDKAHTELWRRFMDEHGVMLDFTDLDGKVDYPTPEECREGKPNALGWWAPIENGAMFNGLYLDGVIARWQHTKSDADATKARRLMEGLLFLNSISDVKGFVGRGVSTDGKSHYAMGSNDQTAPWFFGLWRYWQSGIATEAEKQRIKTHLAETAEAIVKLNWRMPAEQPFGTRGGFGGFHFEEVSRMLFVMRFMHLATSDSKWLTMYEHELQQRGGEDAKSKLEVCAGGMKFFYAKKHNWTSCVGVAALRALWEMEADATRKAAFEQGLIASAKLAAESLNDCASWKNDDTSKFDIHWRTTMLPLWKPQRKEQEAAALAEAQLKAFMKDSPRRGKETALVREPTSAAWIVALCPDAALIKQHREAIEKVINAYDYNRLYYCTFFWVEGAWWRLQ